MKKEFFIHNREKLLEKLEDNSLVILYATSLVTRSEDEYYSFVPNRNFFYITGVNEPDDVFVLYKGKENDEFIFLTRFDETKAKWVGRTYNNDEVKKMGGINKYYYLDEMDKVINDFIKTHKVQNIYMDHQGFKDISESQTYKFYSKKFPKLLKTSKDVYEIIANLRLVKEDEEIKQIEKAIHITNIALEEVKKEIKPGVNENDLASLFAYHIFKNGCSDFAFHTIAASGKHSCTLHYGINNDVLPKDSVILFDLGAAYSYYSADISRTFPTSLKFTNRQQQIYDLVLKAQEVVFKNAKPGVTIYDLNKMVIDFYAVELKKIGLIEKTEDVRKYYYHSCSHHLGLDTHDVCALNARSLALVKGHVITVEPGLYIEEEGIGVRIEDDILITDKGCKILSKEIAK